MRACDPRTIFFVFQLPPVSRTSEYKFAFEAKCWPTVIGRNFELQRVFRQVYTYYG